MTRSPKINTTLSQHGTTRSDVPYAVAPNVTFNLHNSSQPEFNFSTQMFARNDVDDERGKKIQKMMAEAYEKEDLINLSKLCLDFAQYFYDKKDLVHTQEYINASTSPSLGIKPEDLASNLMAHADKTNKNQKPFAKLLRNEAGNIRNAVANLFDSEGKHKEAKEMHKLATRSFFKVFGEKNLKEETPSLDTDISTRASYKKFVQSLYGSGGYNKVITYCDHALSQIPDDEYFSLYRGLGFFGQKKVVVDTPNNSTLSDLFHSALKNFNHRLLEDYNNGKYGVVVKALPILEDQNLKEHHLIKRTKFITGKACNRLGKFDEAYNFLNELALEEKFAPQIFFELGKAEIKTNQQNKSYNHYGLFVQNSDQAALINEIAHDVLSNQNLVITEENFDLVDHLSQTQQLSDTNRLALERILVKNAQNFTKEGREKEALDLLNKINPSTISDRELLHQTALAYYALHDFEKALPFYKRLEHLPQGKLRGTSENHKREILEETGDTLIALCLKDPESLKNPRSITKDSFKDSKLCEENIKKSHQYYEKAFQANGGSDDLELLEKIIPIAHHLGIDNEEHRIHRQHILLPDTKPYSTDIGLVIAVLCAALCLASMECGTENFPPSDDDTPPNSPRNYPQNPNAIMARTSNTSVTR